ncbi:hypothetical protein Tco_0672587 [Tanacetum coccineum]
MFDEYFEVTRVDAPVPSATVVNAHVVNAHVVPPGTSVSTTFAQDAPSTSFSPSSSGIQPPVIQHDVAVGPTIEDTLITQATLNLSNNPITGEPGFTQSSSEDVSLAEPNQVTQPPDHLRKWSKDHPLDNIVGNPSRPVSTRKQLASDALWCSMQNEIREFDHLKVWVLVPKLKGVMIIALKWIYKVKLGEYGDILKKQSSVSSKEISSRRGATALYAVTMSNTLDQSTSTYVTISSESKWKIEWLNSTLWKRTINLWIYLQRHCQENGSESYEFLLADKRCVIDAEVFRKILDICPRKEGEDFTEVQNDEDTLTFLVDLGYSRPLYKYTNMFVDHMHQPLRTLAACINKCLSGKIDSNDKLRKSRIDILWGHVL